MSCVIFASFPRTPKSWVYQYEPITNDIGFESMPKLGCRFYMLDQFVIIFIDDFGIVCFTTNRWSIQNNKHH